MTEQSQAFVPQWVRAEPDRVLAFAGDAAHPDGGFAWLDSAGAPVPERPVETWITCRTTHVLALAVAQGRDELRPGVEHGVTALRGLLHDDDNGGWFASATAAGPVADHKGAYEHAFVLLAAASAAAIGADGGRALLDEALEVFDSRFWQEEFGLVADSWDRTWSELEPYRGVNANMHTVEALLAAADVTGDRRWSDRAARIVANVVHGFAREHDWRLPEHFDPGWNVLLDYNLDKPADQFRPYGVTIGHLLEWSRLALHVRHALGDEAPGWLLDDARELFATAVRDGWNVDGAEGFVYTTDFDGAPVVRNRLHWVIAESLATAWALHQATGDEQYARWFATWAEHAESHFVDRELGSWRHELDERNRPAATVWEGKPDLYHAYQATLLPQLPPAASFIGAVTG
ncbi:AGE family epimerase/isomerase [Saccharopolyspora gloriosae]|uniref:Mannose/cellobiose epimerase-like protein (N-acyl-D-glucosamine 2-epimerase family) n=1 Tax=Saccharopolyspora gloriosae TaxID=455344 RepID=A0A840NB04_9PSEU|nr:mannose/cellobiose epimerase-like protein (N-acyl-D-glucosamine 2-epimerase family) [Saccharopolyspora gloriosae]